MIHLDTTFLVDLLRETTRKTAGPATRFLDARVDEDLWIDVHVACELLAGAELSPQPSREREHVRRLFEGVRIAYPDARFPPAYARLLAWHERAGRRVPTMDLLIATAAVVDQAPLVTRNVKDFSRIPDLVVLGY